MKKALVLGGTGAVGRAVVRALHEQGLSVSFTYRRSAEAAATLAAAIDGRALSLDLCEAGALTSLLASPAFADLDVAVHCAGELTTAPLAELTDADWERSYAVNARSAFELCRGAGAVMAARGGGDILIVGGLDRAQSLPLPVAYAAGQGMISGLVMAAAKELGPRGVRLNMLALGLLAEGASAALAPKLREDYRSFSALRRYGTPDEVARTVAFFATRNTFVTGRVIAVNGGI